MMTIFIFIASALSCYVCIISIKVKNTEFNQLGVISGEDYRLPMDYYFVGDLPVFNSNYTTATFTTAFEYTYVSLIVDAQPIISLLAYQQINGDYYVQNTDLSQIALLFTTGTTNQVGIGTYNTNPDLQFEDSNCRNMAYLDQRIIVGCGSIQNNQFIESFHVFQIDPVSQAITPYQESFNLGDFDETSEYTQKMQVVVIDSEIFVYLLTYDDQQSIFSAVNPLTNKRPTTFLCPVLDLVDFFIESTGRVYCLYSNTGLKIYSSQGIQLYETNPADEYFAMGVNEQLVAITSDQGLFLFVVQTGAVVLNDLVQFSQPSANIYVSGQFITVVSDNLIQVYASSDLSEMASQAYQYSASTYNYISQQIAFIAGMNYQVNSIRKPMMTANFKESTFVQITSNQCSIVLYFVVVTVNSVIPSTTTNLQTILLYYPINSVINLSQYFQGPQLTFNIQQQSQFKLETKQLLTSENHFTGNYAQVINYVLFYQNNGIIIYESCDLICQSGPPFHQTYILAEPNTVVQFDSSDYEWGYLTDTQVINIYELLTNKLLHTIQFGGEQIITFSLQNHLLFVLTDQNLYYSVKSQMVAVQSIAATIQVATNRILLINSVSYQNYIILILDKQILILRYYNTVNQLQVMYTKTFDNQITLGGLTRQGLYLVMGQTIKLFPDFHDFTIGYDIPSFGYQFISSQSTDLHFYLEGVLNGKYSILVYQQSNGQLNSLYYAHPLEAQSQFSVSVEQIVIVSNNNIIGATLMDNFLVEISGSQSLEQQQGICSVQAQYLTQVAQLQFNATSFNYLDFVSVKDASVQTFDWYPSSTTVLVDPRELYVGNSEYYAATVDEAGVNIIVTQPIKSSKYSIKSLEQTSSAVVLDNDVLIQTVQGAVYNTSQSLTVPIYEVQTHKTGLICPFIFIEFYTSNPISVCYEKVSGTKITYIISFFQFNAINDQIYTIVYPDSYTSPLIGGIYNGGLLTFIFQKGTATAGLYIGATTASINTQYGQYVPIPIRFQQSDLLISLSSNSNLQQIAQSCSTLSVCAFPLTTLRITSSNTVQGIIYSVTLQKELVQYYNGQVSQFVSNLAAPASTISKFYPDLTRVFNVPISEIQIVQILQVSTFNAGDVPILITAKQATFAVTLHFQALTYIYSELNSILTVQDPLFMLALDYVVVASSTNQQVNRNQFFTFGNISGIPTASVIASYFFEDGFIYGLPQLLKTDFQIYYFIPNQDLFNISSYVSLTLQFSTKRTIDEVPCLLTSANYNGNSQKYITYATANLSLKYIPKEAPHNTRPRWSVIFNSSLGILCIFGLVIYIVWNCFRKSSAQNDDHFEMMDGVKEE